MSQKRPHVPRFLLHGSKESSTRKFRRGITPSSGGKHAIFLDSSAQGGNEQAQHGGGADNIQAATKASAVGTGRPSAAKAGFGRRRCRRMVMEQSASARRSGLSEAAVSAPVSAVGAALRSTMMHHTHVLLLPWVHGFYSTSVYDFPLFAWPFCVRSKKGGFVSSFICNKGYYLLVFSLFLCYITRTQRSNPPLKERWK